MKKWVLRIGQKLENQVRGYLYRWRLVVNFKFPMYKPEHIHHHILPEIYYEKNRIPTKRKIGSGDSCKNDWAGIYKT